MDGELTGEAENAAILSGRGHPCWSKGRGRERDGRTNGHWSDWQYWHWSDWQPPPDVLCTLIHVVKANLWLLGSAFGVLPLFSMFECSPIVVRPLNIVSLQHPTNAVNRDAVGGGDGDRN